MPTRGVSLGLRSVWSEEIWIHLIDVVKEVEEDISQSKGRTRKLKRKWDLVAKKLHKRLKLNSNEAKELQSQFIANRFYRMASLVKGTSKSMNFRKGDTSASVVEKMKNYKERKCLPSKAGCEEFKSARTCFEEENEDDSEVFKSPHASFEEFKSPCANFEYEKEEDEEELKSAGASFEDDRDKGSEEFKSPCANFEYEKEEDEEELKSARASPEDGRTGDLKESKASRIGPEDDESWKSGNSCEAYTNKAKTRLQEQVAKEFHALGEWFSRELIPIAKNTTFEIILSADTRDCRCALLHALQKI